MQLRKFENFHIVLWLMKDTCWAADFRMGGMFMILPTFGMALFLTIRSRKERPELFHNIAVLLWIAANSTWMIGEFMGYDQVLRPAAVIIFLVGLSVIGIYYLGLVLRRKA